MIPKLIISTIILVVSSILLSAQPFKGNERNRDLIKEKLNLSEEQKNKIHEIRFEHQNNAIELKAELQKNRLAQKQLLSKDNFDKSEYLAFVEKGNMLRSKLRISQAEMKLNILEQLDDDQKEIWLSSKNKTGIGKRTGRGNLNNRNSKNSGMGKMNRR